MPGFSVVIDALGVTVVASAIWGMFVALPLKARHAALQSYVSMARAVETREPHLLGQSARTARYVKIMGWLSGSMPPWQISQLETAALLHTIGKVGVSYTLLNTPHSLSTVSERYAVREYVRIGAAMLDAVPSLKGSAEAVLYHREYLDGSGYPFGRFGQDIPLSARMLCVASEFVALTSPRIYRSGLVALDSEAALRHLRRYIDKRYDRRCVALIAIAHNIVQFIDTIKHPSHWRTRRQPPTPLEA